LSANSDVDAAVKSLFTVKDYMAMEEGAAEYRVVYEPASGKKFLKLLDMLKPLGHQAQLYGKPEDATLAVIKWAPQATAARASVFLFFLTLLSVFVTGYVIASIFPQVAPASSPLEMGVGFEAGLLAFLFGREIAQRYAARRGGFSPLSYYLPNLPLVTPLPVMYFLPTFGAISFPRTAAANRDLLFDYYLVGSLVGVAVAAAVAFLGAGSSVVLTHAQYVSLLAANQTSTLSTNPSLLQGAIMSAASAMGLSKSVPTGGTIIFSPIEVAAWLGLLLSFFNLMPAALFDGGRMGKLVLGERGARMTTFAVAILLLTDIPNYWVVFLLVFLIGAFQTSGDTLDSISGLSGSRRTLFVLATLLTLVCVPFPQTFATFALG